MPVALGDHGEIEEAVRRVFHQQHAHGISLWSLGDTTAQAIYRIVRK
jgi:hypothetical protein